MREQEQRQSKAHERIRAYVAETKQGKSDCDAEINSLRSYDRHKADSSIYKVV